jgi:hypothetical protein
MNPTNDTNSISFKPWEDAILFALTYSRHEIKEILANPLCSIPEILKENIANIEQVEKK